MAELAVATASTRFTHLTMSAVLRPTSAKTGIRESVEFDDRGHRKRLPRPAPASVLGCGAFLNSRTCLLDAGQIIWSPLHRPMHGARDISPEPPFERPLEPSPERLAERLAERLSESHGAQISDVDSALMLKYSIETLCSQPGALPQAVAHDLHPDFPSTRLAQSAALRLGVPAIAVQHHHAHVAAVIATLGLREPVIGLALDGLGLGTDGEAWGGEILQVAGGLEAHRWERLAHLQPLVLPGGDKAAREPWRLAAALLHAADRGDEICTRFATQVGSEAVRIVKTMLTRELNCPRSSSAGRWFDLAAAALGVSVRQQSEAQAARALETLANRWMQEHPDFDWPWQSLDLRPLVLSLFDVNRDDEQAVAKGAAMFHLALVNALVANTCELTHQADIHDVVLGGGCLANRVLRSQLISRLQQQGLRVHHLSATASGDAGLALGQAWVAACILADDHAQSDNSEHLMNSPQHTTRTHPGEQ